MSRMQRRKFVKSSLFATASLGLLPGFGRAEDTHSSIRLRPEGANGDIRVAVVGFGGRGKDHIASFSALPGVRLVALCDVDSAILEKAVQKQQDEGKPVHGYQDIRRLLENKDIDV